MFNYNIPSNKLNKQKTKKKLLEDIDDVSSESSCEYSEDSDYLE